jgi:hypothetical protein
VSVAELRALKFKWKGNLKDRQKNRQKEENEYMLGRNKEELEENLTSRISPRKISFFVVPQEFKEMLGRNVNKYKFFFLFFSRP